MSNYKDPGEKSDESTSEVSASFTCQDCGDLRLPSRTKGTHTLANENCGEISYSFIFQSGIKHIYEY